MLKSRIYEIFARIAQLVTRPTERLSNYSRSGGPARLKSFGRGA